MFKDFDISSFKKMKPFSDNSFDTDQEVKALKKIKLNKSFVKKYDNIEGAFEKTAKDNNIKYGEALKKAKDAWKKHKAESPEQHTKKSKPKKNCPAKASLGFF